MSCYCEIGHDDNWPAFYAESMVKARKAHRCIECLEPIAIGETYQRVRGKWDGDVKVIKTCVHCVELRKEALDKTDGEIAFGQLACWYSGVIEGVACQMELERGLPTGALGAAP